MSRLIISNQLTEETAEGDAALPADYLAMLGSVSHRMIWLAGPCDVVVLPTAPDPDFVEYVWRLRGFGARRPHIVVPPPGRQGSDLLYSYRLADTGFRRQLQTSFARSTADGSAVDEVLAFFVDDDVSDLAIGLGLSGAVPAHDFLADGGNDLVNSKSVFRTICRGNSVAVPRGRAVTDRDEAEELVWSLVSTGRTAIVKQDAHGGGYGNEILTPDPDLSGLGAATQVHVTDRGQLAERLAAGWSRYTYGGARAVVIDHYVTGCVPIYLELAIGSDGVRRVGYGEMRMKPVNNGLIVPPPSRHLPAFAEFLASGDRIGQAYRALGYRGRASVDAIVTPDGEILFNELNGRVGGSTHVHQVGDTVIGGDYLTDRVLIARNRCDWDDVAGSLTLLGAAGLLFDPATRSGVLLTGDDGQLLFVAPELEGAAELERAAVCALGLSAA